jgi:DNA-binding HxlR family transcriptional regulator
MRFMDLQRCTTAKARSSISRKVLRDELLALEHSRLVTRLVGPALKPPLQTLYGLTPWGARLTPITSMLAEWVLSGTIGDERVKEALWESGFRIDGASAREENAR